MSTIPDPGFPDDDGSADPALAAALAAYDGGGAYADALAALASSRLLVPVVAVAGEGADGEKSSDMATVLIARPDGRRGMLAFTSTDALAAWDRAARPVPVPVQVAAQAAIQEGAAALLVDLAGPVRFVVTGDDVLGLAHGWQLTTVAGRSGWIRPGGE